MVKKGKSSIRIWLKNSTEDKTVEQNTKQPDKEAGTPPVEKIDLIKDAREYQKTLDAEWEAIKGLGDEPAKGMWQIEHGESEAKRLKDLEELPGYGSDEQERE